MLLTSRELIATELERLRESDQSEADLAAIDRSLAAITRRQTVTARSIALLTDADAAAPLVATLESLAQQRRQLEADRATMIAQRSDWQNARRQLTDLDRWCEAMAETLDTLDYAGRRRVLQALGVDVRVSLTGEIDVVTAIKLPDPFHIARS